MNVHISLYKMWHLTREREKSWCTRCGNGSGSGWNGRMQWMKVKLNKIISNIILWWSCERVKWDEWNVWNSIFLVSFAIQTWTQTHSFSVTHFSTLTVRFSWILLININFGMVRRIMVFAFLSVCARFWCVCNFDGRFFLPSPSDILALCVVLLVVALAFLIVFLHFQNKLTLWHIVHTSFFVCKFIAEAINISGKRIMQTDGYDNLRIQFFCH